MKKDLFKESVLRAWYTLIDDKIAEILTTNPYIDEHELTAKYIVIPYRYLNNQKCVRAPEATAMNKIKKIRKTNEAPPTHP